MGSSFAALPLRTKEVEIPYLVQKEFCTNWLADFIIFTECPFLIIYKKWHAVLNYHHWHAILVFIILFYNIATSLYSFLIHSSS